MFRCDPIALSTERLSSENALLAIIAIPFKTCHATVALETRAYEVSGNYQLFLVGYSWYLGSTFGQTWRFSGCYLGCHSLARCAWNSYDHKLGAVAAPKATRWNVT